MKKIIFLMLTVLSFPLATMAQSYDDLYYIPKKEKDKEEKKEVVVPVKEKKEVSATIYAAPGSTVVVQDRKGNVRDVDEYNRRYNAKDNDFVMENDTLYIKEKAANALTGEWVDGFEGSQDDYEYAERIIRFRNPRYAIPISSPYYWDVVYGLNSWNWNVYTDDFYAYAFPTFSNRLWWDWRYGSVGWGWGPGWGYGYGYGWNSWYAGSYWGWGGYWPGYWYGGWGHHHYPNYWYGGGWHSGGGHWASAPVYHNTRRSEFAGSSNKGTVSARRSDYNGTATRVGSTTTSARRSASSQTANREEVTSSRRVVGTRTPEATRPSGSAVTRPSTGTSSSSSSSTSTYNNRRSSSSGTSTSNSGSSSSSRNSYTPSSSSRAGSSVSSGSSSSSRSSGSSSSGGGGGSSRSSGGGSRR
jgi:hypothetical protein